VKGAGKGWIADSEFRWVDGGKKDILGAQILSWGQPGSTDRTYWKY